MKKAISLRRVWPIYAFSALLMISGVFAVATDYRFSGREVFTIGFVAAMIGAKRHGHLTKWHFSGQTD